MLIEAYCENRKLIRVVVRCTIVIVCGHLNYLVMYCVRCFMLYTDKPVWQMDVLQSYIPSWL